MSEQSEHERRKTALNVMQGISSSHDGLQPMKRRRFKRKENPIQTDELAHELMKGSRLSLAKGITLLESIAIHDKPAGQELLRTLLPYTGNSIRI